MFEIFLRLYWWTIWSLWMNEELNFLQLYNGYNNSLRPNDAYMRRQTVVTIIGSDNGLAPGWHQAIIWINTGILLIGPLGTYRQWNFNQNSNIFIEENMFQDVNCKMLFICLGLIVLTYPLWDCIWSVPVKGAPGDANWQQTYICQFDFKIQHILHFPCGFLSICSQ